jgi:hypothetical protein
MSFKLSDQSYEIRDELRIRNILEEHTDWQYEFTKNDKYEYDLQLFTWPDPPHEGDDRELAGYVEIERANKNSDWQSGRVPGYWPEIRFCRRKIDRGEPPHWRGPKKNHEQTVYLKFNHEINSCIAASLPDIRNHGEETYWPEGKRTRESAFYALPHRSEHIAYGIIDCIDLVTEHLTDI